MATSEKRNRSKNFTDNEVDALVLAYKAQENFLNVEHSTPAFFARSKIWKEIAEHISSIDGTQRTAKQCATKIKNLKQKNANGLFSSESNDNELVDIEIRQPPSECVFCSQCADPFDTPQLSVELVEAVCKVLHLVSTTPFNWKKCLLQCSLCASCRQMVINAQELMVALDRLQNKIDRISTSIGNAIRKGHFDLQNERIITEESSLTGGSSLPSPSELRAQLATFLKLRPSKFGCEESKEEILDVGITEDSLGSNFDHDEVEETSSLLENVESTVSCSKKSEPDFLTSNLDMSACEVEIYEPTHEDELSVENYETENKKKLQKPAYNCTEDGNDDEERNRAYSKEGVIESNSDDIRQTDSPRKKFVQKQSLDFSKNEIRVLWTEFRKRKEKIKSVPQSFVMWSQIAKFVSGVSKFTCGRSATECRMKIKNLHDNSIDVEEFLKQTEEEEEEPLESNSSECFESPENDLDENTMNNRFTHFSEAEVKALCTQYFEQRENFKSVDKIQRQDIWDYIAKVVSYVGGVKRRSKTCQTKMRKLEPLLVDLSSLDANAPTSYQHLFKTELSGKAKLSKFDNKTNKHEDQDRSMQFDESRKPKQAPLFTVEEVRVLHQEAKKWGLTLKDRENSPYIYRQIAVLVSGVSNIKRTAMQCCLKIKNMRKSVVDYDRIFEQEGNDANADHMECKETNAYVPQFSQNHKTLTTDQNFRNSLEKIPIMKPQEYEMVLPAGVVLLQNPELQLTRCDDPDSYIKTDETSTRLENLRTVRLKQIIAKLYRKRRTETISKAEKRSQLIGECLKRRQKKRQLVEGSQPNRVGKQKEDVIGNSPHLQYTCPVDNCGEKLEGAVAIERHVSYEHATVDTPPSHHCDIETCWRSYHTIQGLERHKARCHDESVRKFLCDICAKTYISLNLLNTHKRYSHNNIRVFRCEICGKSYKCKYQLTNHQSMIHGDIDPERFKPDHLTCPICSYHCWSVSLKKHMKRHTGAYKLTCSEVGCNYKTDKLHELKNHKLAHSDERNSKCHLCPMTYKRTAELKRHLRRHEGILNYKCPHCEKAFAVKSYLTNHINVIHDRQIRFTCQDCGEGFPILKYYHKHRSVVHKGTNNAVNGTLRHRTNGKFAIGYIPTNRTIQHQSQ